LSSWEFLLPGSHDFLCTSMSSHPTSPYHCSCTFCYLNPTWKCPPTSVSSPSASWPRLLHVCSSCVAIDKTMPMARRGVEVLVTTCHRICTRDDPHRHLARPQMPCSNTCLDRQNAIPPFCRSDNVLKRPSSWSRACRPCCKVSRSDPWA